MARVSTSELSNLKNLDEGVEVEAIYLGSGEVKSNKGGKEEVYVYHKLKDTKTDEDYQIFGSGLLNYHIKKMCEAMGDNALGTMVWITFTGKKEVSKEVSQSGFVNQYDMDYDNGE